MKKKCKLTVSIIAVLVCVCAIAVGAFASLDPVSNTMQRLGEIDRKNDHPQTAGVAYAGDHITISKSEIEQFKARFLLAGEPSETAESAALKAIAIREIFCYRAEEFGIVRDNELFLQWLSDYRSSVESASNKDDFYAYVEGMQMTPEEYWAWAETSTEIQNEWYSSLFIQKLQEDFAAEHELEIGSPEFYEKWVEYFSAYKDESYDKEHIHKVSGNSVE